MATIEREEQVVVPTVLSASSRMRMPTTMAERAIARAEAAGPRPGKEKRKWNHVSHAYLCPLVALPTVA
jgi:hypothetical protein